jgi:phage anti-repressor protein
MLSKEDKALKKELTEFVEKFEPYSKHFANAMRNYVIIRPQDLGAILTLRYGSDWKSKVSKQVTTCAQCKLNELKKIAIEIDSSKRTLEQLAEKAKQKQTESEE